VLQGTVIKVLLLSVTQHGWRLDAIDADEAAAALQADGLDPRCRGILLHDSGFPVTLAVCSFVSATMVKATTLPCPLIWTVQARCASGHRVLWQQVPVIAARPSYPDR
jgi:hypothetical protein